MSAHLNTTPCNSYQQNHKGNQENTRDHNHKRKHSPCCCFFYDNFTIGIQLYFIIKFLILLVINKYGGIVLCDFTSNKMLANMNLSNDALKLRDVPNAGGSSEVSEMLAFEVLHKCFKARLVKTETEVSYFPEGGSLTDYMCEIFNYKVGMSVTRAMKYRGRVFTRKDAEQLLIKKLKRVIESSKNSLEKRNKQILHVWSTNDDITNTLVKVYSKLPAEDTSNTVVVVTTTTIDSNFIYNNNT